MANNKRFQYYLSVGSCACGVAAVIFILSSERV